MEHKKIELNQCPFCGRHASMIKNDFEETVFTLYFVFHSR